MRVAPEGYPFVIGSLLLSGIAFIIAVWVLRHTHGPVGKSLALAVLGVSLCLFFFMAYFFRDPERVIPEGDGLFVAPADGRVIRVREVSSPENTGPTSHEISIFMSPFDVHVNRSPCDGKVTVVRYSPGKFLAAYRDDASLKNEHAVMVLEREGETVTVRQVAGFLARRVVCRVKKGMVLRRGERYGIIKFGSRLDVYLPMRAVVTVRVGEKTRAGETVIAIEENRRGEQEERHE